MRTDDGDIVSQLRRIKEAIWNEGFYAGQVFGRANERYDPSRDREDEEPSRPENPYSRAA